MEASVSGQANANFSYDSSTDFGTGESGLYSDKTNVTFDDFAVHDGTTRAALAPRFGGLADASIVSGELLVQGSTRGGEAIVENFQDSDYMVEISEKLNTGASADIWFRYTDANNGYRVRLDSTRVSLFRFLNGKGTSLASVTYTVASPNAIKIKASGTTLKVWVDGTLKINTTDGSLTAGGVALGGDKPKDDNLKIGYDNNSDDDIDDAGDDVAVDESFGSTSKTVTYDDAGNLVDDGTFWFKYDAWNRLVKVQQAADSGAVTIQTAAYDGTGRRLKKVVTKSGDLNGTTVYLYNGQQIIETRDGSGNLLQQFIHGTQYIDELVMVRTKDKGDLYYHQDANWNVIAMTDLAGRVVERWLYTPYGEPTVHEDSGYGDRDGDGDVDSTDKGTVGVDCTGTVSGSCRILDLDFDGDYDSTDATKLDALPSGIRRQPGRQSSGLSQPFGHQGLVYDAETASYQHRVREYGPQLRRFLQRDRFGHAGGNHLYNYLASNPAIYTDSSGTLHRHQVNQSTSWCGGHTQTWLFHLDGIHTCHGYIVQKIIWRTSYKWLPPCCDIPFERTLIYWEAFEVLPGQSFPLENDYWWLEPVLGTLGGTDIKNGEARFYCLSVTDLSNAGFTSWGASEAGGLPSTYVPPAFWSHDPDEPGDYARCSARWNNCCGTLDDTILNCSTAISHH